MTRSLAEILDERDDALLCRDLAHFLFPDGARDRKLRSLPKPQRVVRLVWRSSQILASNGLRPLLETGVSGDRGLRVTVKAYDVIGCPAAAQVLRIALAIFPESRLPRDPVERKALVEAHAGEVAAIASTLRGLPDQIQHALATYIRNHRDALLTGGAPKAPKAPKLQASPKDLPHWARVLFAARCAKVVLPLLRIHWPMMVRPRKLAIKRAIHVAAKSAIEGATHAGTTEAVILAEQTAGAAHGGRTPADVEPRAGTGVSRTIASFVAKAAEKAAHAAELPAAESTVAVEDGFRFAQSAALAAGATVMTRKLTKAFQQLYSTAQSGEWTDTTPVPRELWDAL